jgi:hypothetical protein
MCVQQSRDVVDFVITILIPLFCTVTNESGLDHTAGKSALMIVLLLHRKGLQTLLSLSVDDCLCTLWNYIL